MAIHELKIKSQWFERVKSGEKRVEIREHDRDYQVGDLLRLTEVDERGQRVGRYVKSGRDERGRFAPGGWRDSDPIRARILHVLPASQVDGLQFGYVALSIEVVTDND